MTTQVVTVSSRTPNEPYYRLDLFLESLRRFGVEPTVLGMVCDWRGLMTKPRLLYDWLASGACTADELIVCDAWDILFTAHPDEVGAAYRERWNGECVVFNAERGIFPRADLAHHFPDTGTPWRYLNSGFMIGLPAQILALLTSMLLPDIHNDHQLPDGRWVHPNDQGWYQVAWALRVVPMALDAECRICQTGSACPVTDFDFDGERIKNVITGTAPLVWHFNGDAKNLLLPAVCHKMGLAL